MFSNVTSPSTKAKLRILFEVAPLGLLVEKAGGASSCDGQQKSTLDVEITKHDQVSSCLGLRGAGMDFSVQQACPGRAISCNGQQKSTLDVHVTKCNPASCSLCCGCAHAAPCSTQNAASDMQPRFPGGHTFPLPMSPAPISTELPSMGGCDLFGLVGDARPQLQWAAVVPPECPRGQITSRDAPQYMCTLSAPGSSVLLPAEHQVASADLHALSSQCCQKFYVCTLCCGEAACLLPGLPCCAGQAAAFA